MVRTFGLFVFTLALGACAQPARFRYLLRDSPDLPAATRRQIDSLRAINDSVHRCPPRADTLWAADRRVAIPPVWLEASVAEGCRLSGLPNAVRRRLRDDPSSLRYYEAVASGAVPRGEVEQATAVAILQWSGRRRYLPLFLRIAGRGAPDATTDQNAAYGATLALAPYLYESAAARRVVLRHASNASSAFARQAGIRALATANTPWSRRVLRRVARDRAGGDEMRFVRNALARPPCRPGTIFVEWWGIEGQNFSKCEPPPDLR